MFNDLVPTFLGIGAGVVFVLGCICAYFLLCTAAYYIRLWWSRDYYIPDEVECEDCVCADECVDCTCNHLFRGELV